MLISCPTCGATLRVDDGAGGSKVLCGKCSQRILVPSPPAANKTVLGRIVEQPPSEPPPLPPPLPPRDLRRPPKAHRDNSAAWIVLTVVMVLVVSLGGIACVVLILPPSAPLAPPAPRHNAKCPQCGQQFNIPVHHGIGQWTVDYRCPNCHDMFPAAMLYIRPLPPMPPPLPAPVEKVK